MKGGQAVLRALTRDAASSPRVCPRLITVDDPAYDGELELRYRVLRAPLGQSRAAVLFPFERESLHLVAERDARVVGCVLFHPESATTGRLFQMAVMPDDRRSGLGRRLVATLEDELRERGIGTVHLHARAGVVGFYERLGYAVFGDPFVEVGLAHRHMQKTL